MSFLDSTNSGGSFDDGNALDIIQGGFDGSNIAGAASDAADVTNAELMRQFEQTQANLAPALAAAKRQLPGIESQLRPDGFMSTMGELSPELMALMGSVEGSRGQAGMDMLSSAGIEGDPAMRQALSEIDPATFNEMLLAAEGDLYSNRVGIAGIGEGSGTVLSQLGQRTGSGMVDANSQALDASLQASAQGKENAMGVVSMIGSFFSDERLKNNIEDVATCQGLRVIRWTWKDAVPESWRDVTVGFSAQDVLSKLPQFVTEREGFLAIDRDGLLDYLEASHA